jgi:hypothetical protein
MSDIRTVDWSDDGPSCWCGRPGVGATVVVAEHPAQATVGLRCPDHGLVRHAEANADTVVRALDGVPAPTVRWRDLPTAALTVALVGASLPAPILLVDPDGHAVVTNRAWSALTGLSSRASRGPRWLSVLDVAEGAAVITCLRSEIPTRVGVQRAGRTIDRRLVPRPMVDEDGAVIGHVITLLEPEEAGPESPGSTTRVSSGAAWGREMALHELVIKGVTDALERRHGVEHTIALSMILVERAEPTGPGETRPPDERGGPINDPVVLAALADRISGSTDIDDVVYELGDGNFAVLADQADSYRRTVDWAERLIRLLAEPIASGETWTAPRASIGVAFPHLPVETADALVAKAERALRLALASGGRRVEVVIGSGPGSGEATLAARASS